MNWVIETTDENGKKTTRPLIDMCKDCEDKLFIGIECKGCRCSCHSKEADSST